MELAYQVFVTLMFWVISGKWEASSIILSIENQTWVSGFSKIL